MPTLSQSLTIAHWFARQLGFADRSAMLSAMSDAGEGRVLNFLEDSRYTPNIPPALLRQLDTNIAIDLAAINRRRTTH